MDKKTDKKFKKSNILIGAKYRSTLMENKILAVALSKIESAKEAKDGSLISSMSAAELRELFGDDTGSIYRHLRPVAEGMTGRVLGMEDPKKKEFRYIAVVTSAEYQDGVFTITFNPKLRDQIMNIQNKFTLLSLPTMMAFHSVYSFRLYELLKSETFIGNHNCQYTTDGGFEFLIGLSELKLELGIIDAENEKVKRILAGSPNPDFDKAVEAAPEKRFTQWYDFKRRVLDTAREEINRSTTTDMEIDFSPKREGRGGKVKAIEFKIQYSESKEPDKKTDVVEVTTDKKTDIIDLIDQVMLIISEKITARDAEAILKAADYDINRIKDAYEIASDNVDNIVGWMISAVREGYRKPVKKKKNTRYDIEEIERTLVANRPE